MSHEQPITAIDRRALRGLVDRGAVALAEASSFPFFADAHLPGAVSLPCDQVAELAPSLLPDRSRPVVVYAGGPTSANGVIVARRLVALGYRDVAVYTGGKQDWVEAGLPVVREPDGGTGRR